jgi:hypothetical protein
VQLRNEAENCDADDPRKTMLLAAAELIESQADMITALREMVKEKKTDR